MNTMDSRGAWVTEISVRQYDKGMLDVPQVTLQGIDMQVFIQNFGVLSAYVGAK